MPATIAWVSDGEQARPRRRRGRRRGKRAAAPADTGAKQRAEQGESTPAKQSRAGRQSADRLRTVHETSAGGLVVDGLDGPRDSQVAALIGRIDRRGRTLWSLPNYWFVTEGRRVHKTVHHYLLRFLGGELSDHDLEVSEVAWVPLAELPSRLAYADERRLAEVAGELIQTLHTHGPGALPPLPHSSPWRRRQTHSRTRRRSDEPGSGRTNGHGQQQ
jgi:hypothetical protein